MNSYFDWADAKARKQTASEVACFDVVDWPDIAVTETELSLEDTAKLRALLRASSDDISTCVELTGAARNG